MIPVYGFVEGDSLGLLILTAPDETIAALADKIQAAASVRVAPRAAVELRHAGRTLAPDTTVRTARIEPLDRVDVVPVAQAPGTGSEAR